MQEKTNPGALMDCNVWRDSNLTKNNKTNHINHLLQQIRMVDASSVASVSSIGSRNGFRENDIPAWMNEKSPSPSVNSFLDKEDSVQKYKRRLSDAKAKHSALKKECNEKVRRISDLENKITTDDGVTQTLTERISTSEKLLSEKEDEVRHLQDMLVASGIERAHISNINLSLNEVLGCCSSSSRLLFHLVSTTSNNVTPPPQDASPAQLPGLIELITSHCNYIYNSSNLLSNCDSAKESDKKLQNLEIQVKDLTSDNSKLEAALSSQEYDQRGIIEKLKLEIRELINENEEIVNKNNNQEHSFSSQINDLNTTNEGYIGDVEKLKLRIDDLNTTNSQLQNSLSERQGEQHCEVASLKDQITELTKEVLRYKSNEDNLFQRIQQMETDQENELNKVASEVALLRSKDETVSLGRELEILNNKIADRQKDFSDLEMTNCSLINELSTANDIVVELERVRNTFHERVSELEQTIESLSLQLEGEKSSLSEELTTSNDRVVELENVCNETTAALTSSNRRVAELEQTIESLSLQLEKERTSLSTSNGKVTDLEITLTSSNNRVSELEQIIKSSSAELENIRRHEINDRTVELEKMRSSYTKDMNTSNNKITELEMSIKSISVAQENERSSSHIRLSELEETIEVMSLQRETSNNKVTEMEIELTSSDERVSELEQTIESLSLQLEGEKSSLSEELTNSNDRVVELENVCNETTAALTSSKETITSLSTQLEDIHSNRYKDNVILTDRNIELEANIESLIADRQDSLRENNSLEDKIRTTLMEMDQLTSDNVLIENGISNLRDVVVVLRQTLSLPNTEISLANPHQGIANLTLMVSQVEEAVESLISSFEEEKHRACDLTQNAGNVEKENNKKINELESKSYKLENDFNTQRVELNSLKDSYSDLNSELNFEKSSNSELREKIEKNKNQKQVADDDHLLANNSLKSKLEALTEALEEYQEKVTIYKADIHTTTKQLDSQKQENAQLRIQLENSTRSEDNVREQLSSLSQIASSTSAENSLLREKSVTLEHKNHEISQLQQQVSELLIQIDSLSETSSSMNILEEEYTKLSKCNSEMIDLNEKNKQENEQLKKKVTFLEEGNATCLELQEQIDALNEKCSESENELQTLYNERSSVLTAATEVRDRFVSEASQAEIDHKKKISELQFRIASLTDIENSKVSTVQQEAVTKINSARAETAAAKLDLESLQIECDKIKTDNEIKVKSIQSNETEIQHTLQTTREELNNLSENHSLIQEKYKTQLTTLTELRRDVFVLQEKLQDSNNKNIPADTINRMLHSERPMKDLFLVSSSTQATVISVDASTQATESHKKPSSVGIELDCILTENEQVGSKLNTPMSLSHRSRSESGSIRGSQIVHSDVSVKGAIELVKRKSSTPSLTTVDEISQSSLVEQRVNNEIAEIESSHSTRISSQSPSALRQQQQQQQRSDDSSRVSSSSRQTCVPQSPSVLEQHRLLWVLQGKLVKSQQEALRWKISAEETERSLRRERSTCSSTADHSEGKNCTPVTPSLRKSCSVLYSPPDTHITSESCDVIYEKEQPDTNHSPPDVIKQNSLSPQQPNSNEVTNVIKDDLREVSVPQQDRSSTTAVIDNNIVRDIELSLRNELQSPTLNKYPPVSERRSRSVNGSCPQSPLVGKTFGVAGGRPPLTKQSNVRSSSARSPSPFGSITSSAEKIRRNIELIRNRVCYFLP